MSENKVKIVRLVCLDRRASEDKNSARLLWSIRQGYPRLVVHLDNEAISKEGVNYDKIITAPTDHVSLITFLRNNLKHIKGESEETVIKSLKCYNTKYDSENKPTGEKELRATITIDKDSDNMYYIKVSSPDGRSAKFVLLNSGYITFIDKDNNVIEDKVIRSKIFARNYIRVAIEQLNKYVNEDDKNIAMVNRPTNAQSPIKES